MSVAFQPAWTLSLPVLADLFTKAFTGYVAGSVQMNPASLSSMIAEGGIDLNHSILALRDDAPVGFVLMARQGWTCRVAAMGIVPEAQGEGVGDRLLQFAVEQAAERRERMIELEAFEQNVPAVRLYEKHGFLSLRRLLSFTIDFPVGIASSDLREVDIADAARHVSLYGVPDLPWQVRGSHLMRIAAPFAAYRLDDAYAILSDTSADRVVIRALIVATNARRQGQGRRLISALWAANPGKRWFVPALWPEEFGMFFERCAFQEHTLNQLQMQLRLAETGTWD